MEIESSTKKCRQPGWGLFPKLLSDRTHRHLYDNPVGPYKISHSKYELWLFNGIKSIL